MSARLNLSARLAHIAGTCSLALVLLALAAWPAAARAQDAGVSAPAADVVVLKGVQARQRALDLGLPLRIETAGQVFELQAFYNDVPKYYVTHNAVAADSISTDECRPGGSGGFALTGSGVTLGLWDAGGVRLSHQEFGGRAAQVDSPGDTHYHSTHCAGTMIASGVVASAKGMSPAANLNCWDWDSDETEMRTAAGNGLLVSSHSYGFSTGWTWNSYYGEWFWYGDVAVSATEDNWFGLYTSYTQDVDDTAYDHPYYLICKSAGNDRDDDGPGAGGGHYYYNPGSGSWEWSTTTRDPDGPWDCLDTKSVAKNILVVAAVEDVVGGYVSPAGVVMSYFSSYGPTDDGRIKPDIAGNGVGLYSTFDGSNSDYYSLSGTSMSTPNISGSLGILIQQWRNTHAGQGEMRSATLRGVVLHTADECGAANGPDYSFGWGLMNTLRAAQAIAADVAEPYTISEQVLGNGQTFELNATTAGSSTLKVTICWTDPAGTPPGNLLNPTNPMLVNDLDLRVQRTSPSTTYYPWVLSPASPGSAATTGDNYRDNVEQVVVYSPGTNSYTIRVTHKAALSGGSQAFSLVITGAATIGTVQDSDGDGVPDTIDNCSDDYNPTQADADGDDVGDACDDCPYDANKTEPGLCGCGVPDTDSDNDGTPDCLDDCPYDPDKTEPGQCGCGVADTDTDDDGTADCNDGCPNDPDKIAPGLCGCGAADTDSDSDGTPDCNDGCPSDPDKTEPGVCGCGVADDDSDNDGTPDCDDQCPNDPLKTEPGVCGCGVADDDSDNDGTPDCNDDCPHDPDKIAPGVCGCGMPDTDTDNDGTPDCNDNCPDDPFKTEPGVCGCGVADDDSDNDGTPDCNDDCPADPYKIEPGPCGCGFADTDSDGDGTADCLDNCPDDPNKVDPGVCGCGVADTDSDADGVPDCNDLCPDTPAGVLVDASGCPVIDCNGNGVPDETDIALGTSQDCNENGVPDECDIAAGTSQDTDANGVPDECEAPPVCLGDCNCDGEITFADINAFVSAVTGGVYCDGTGVNADMTADDPIHVGFEDINPFVALLTTNSLPIVCP